MDDSHFKVRPFDRIFETVPDKAVHCSGRIENEAFVFQVGAADHPIKAVEVGSDKWGDYAIIGATEQTLEAGFLLVVEAEPEFLEPGAGIGCSISIKRPSDDVVAMREELRDVGIDPSAAHIMAPPSAMISVYFTSHGTVNGWGGVGFSLPASEPARPN